ncbi:helix-turn-helix domain-containing protein [Lignipirellula cremea]|uniref:Nitrogen fixation protein VnfA n=1 Tax=Lignipirellula cremea TaxID=2528010 RepID=A0A518DZQ5_9BACT|nr:helix-turn-helix domain-containing protein [Lignipirellula cremea]QDU97322.1 Nitrogen fixation protein VnfA [Lignipirellula cremea]
MARIRSRNAALAQVFADCQQPVYVLNDQRQIVFCNEACAAWLAEPIDQIEGRQLDYHSGDANHPHAGLTPPPEAFAASFWRGSVTAGPGSPAPRMAAFTALFDPQGDLTGLLAVVDSAAAPSDSPPPSSTCTAGDTEAEALHQQLLSIRQQWGERLFLDPLLGDAALTTKLRAQVRLAMETRTPVLLVGPAGSGLPQLARAIHAARDPDGVCPLAPLSGSLADAEHVQTSLRSLLRKAPGEPVLRRPVLLLLEADRLQPSAQQELAGFLTLPGFELSILAVAEEPLELLAEKDLYRTDLARVLSPLVVQFPPLADRSGDLPLLAQRALEKLNALGGPQRSGFSEEALDQLAAYPWPGNLDELAEVVEQAHRNARQAEVAAADLPDKIRKRIDAKRYAPQPPEKIDLYRYLSRIEGELIDRAMRLAKGNKTRAAELLGVNRARLIRRINQDD